MATRTQPQPVNVAPDRDAFLNYVPKDRRSFITNLVLYACRRGMTTPSTVLASVEAEIRTCQERARRWRGTDDERYTEAATITAEHRTAALAFCAWALIWERLTPAEKERRRAAQGEQYRRAWMEQQPATDKQIAYVRALGFTGEVTSKAHASELIDRLQGERRAA